MCVYKITETKIQWNQNLTRTLSVSWAHQGEKASGIETIKFSSQEIKLRASCFPICLTQSHSVRLYLPGCLVSIRWPRRPCCCGRYMSTVINTSTRFYLRVNKSRHARKKKNNNNNNNYYIVRKQNPSETKIFVLAKLVPGSPFIGQNVHLYFACFWRHVGPQRFCTVFGRLKDFSRKKSQHVSRPTIGHLWAKYKEFWFFIMCHLFSISLGLSGHSLLKCFRRARHESFNKFLFWCKALQTKFFCSKNNWIELLKEYAAAWTNDCIRSKTSLHF